MHKIVPILFVFTFLFSCHNEEKNLRQTTAPKVVEAKGYVVPKDSMAEPVVIPVDESKLTKVPVGEPMVVPTNTNIHIAITTNIHKAGTPRICTPGKDTFLLPKTVPAIDSLFKAGIPEIVQAKDAYIKVAKKPE